MTRARQNLRVILRESGAIGQVSSQTSDMSDARGLHNIASQSIAITWRYYVAFSC